MWICEAFAGDGEKDSQRRNSWKNISGQLGPREAEEDDRECRPANNEEAGRIAPGFFTPELQPLLRSRNHQDGPRQERQQCHSPKEPERLFVLEHRSQVALEIVLEDKSVNEVRVASCTEDVQRQPNDRDRSECQRMREPKRGAPAPRRESPDADGSCRED